MRQQQRHLNHKIKNSNQGYSLVEMIIVIAIIVVMTGVATVTISMIASARAKEASVTFDSLLSDTITKSKTQLASMTDETTGVSTTYPTYGRCIKVYQASNDKYYMKLGYYDPDASGNARFVFDPADDSLGSGLSSKVQIYYTDSSNVRKKIANSGTDVLSEVYVAFDRAGRCVSGEGVFSFYKKNGNQIADVRVNKNGSHITK